jgi:hypothetical protein
MIDGGYAERVKVKPTPKEEKPPEIESAAVDPQEETAMKPPARRRKPRAQVQ